MSDTRKDKRTPLSLKVRFKSATLDEFVEQYSNDISRGGLFIKSKKPMKVGTLLKFEFQLKDESPLIHGVGRVVWRREPDQGTGTAGMGIKFIKMDPESRAFVQKIVEERADAPGTFDEGDKPAEKPGSFFPGGPAAEQPDPEDRTQVRHASEFLAEALSEGGAAEEANANAEKARARTEEIQREREAAEEARKAEEDAAAEKLAAEEAKRKEAASARAAKEDEGEDEEEVEDEDDLEIAAPIAAVVKPEEPKPAKLEPKPAAPRVERAVSARPAAPDESSGSGMLIAIILLICAVGAGYWWWSNQEQEAVVVEETEEVVEEVVAAATTIESNVVAEILIDGEARGTTPLDISLPVGTEVIITARAAGEEQSRPVMVPESFEGPIRFEFEEAALPWVVTITTTPAGAQLTVDGEAAQNELTLEEAPERMEIMATHPGHRSATATVTAGDFTLSDGAMVYAVALTLQPRAERIEGPTAMTTMTAVMEAAPMETEAATMETAMEAATMEVATMEATMEAEAVTMAPATMEPATMEPATMEPVVPDNPF